MDIGIIGGADGPTKIFLSSKINPYFILLFIAIFIIGLIFWIYKKRK